MRANLAQLQGKAPPAKLRSAKTVPKPLWFDKLIEGSEVRSKSLLSICVVLLVQRPSSKATKEKKQKWIEKKGSVEIIASDNLRHLMGKNKDRQQK